MTASASEQMSVGAALRTGIAWYAMLFSILNAAVLVVRISAEDDAPRIEGARRG